MQVFINKNGQQSGPFAEDIVLEGLLTGRLSPEDMAIRQGETDWQTLRSMFPNAVLPATVNQQTPANQTVQPVKSGNSGCRKILGVLMILLGISTLIGGALFTYQGVLNVKNYCGVYDENIKKMADLKKEYESAKGTSREEKIKQDLDVQLKIAEWAPEKCLYWKNWRNLAIGGLITGLLLSIIGFFVSRVKPSTA